MNWGLSLAMVAGTCWAQQPDEDAAKLVAAMKAADQAETWSEEAAARAVESEQTSARYATMALQRTAAAKWMAEATWEPAVERSRIWIEMAKVQVIALAQESRFAGCKDDDRLREAENAAEAHSEALEVVKTAKQAAKGKSPQYVKWAELRAEWAASRHAALKPALQADEARKALMAIAEMIDDADSAVEKADRLMERAMERAVEESDEAVAARRARARGE